MRSAPPGSAPRSRSTKEAAAFQRGARPVSRRARATWPSDREHNDGDDKNDHAHADDYELLRAVDENGAWLLGLRSMHRVLNLNGARGCFPIIRKAPPSVWGGGARRGSGHAHEQT